MHLHTSLTREQVVSCLPSGVAAHITPKGSRKRERAFEVTLYVFEKDELHRHFGNSGGYGASDEVAATWDEWGVWMAALYALDPDAIVGHYKTYDDFISETTHYRDYVRQYNKPTSIASRTHRAPWLDRARLEELRIELRAERISWGELAELQGLASSIDPGDTELLEAAGVPEHA